MAPIDTQTDIRNEMATVMMACGIDVETLHHEVATAGQAEIDVRFAPLAEMADTMQLFKYIVKNVAAANGKTATFMPKPIFEDNGSGMHTHQSLWKDGKPLFAGEGYAGLSEMALHYIGGLLKARPGPVRLHEPDDQLVQAFGPGLRGPQQARLLGAQSVGGHPHPDLLGFPEGEAPRVPHARSNGQPLPRVRGVPHGWPRRGHQQDRPRQADG